MWTSATCLAELVASGGARPEQSEKERTLSETDFEFRGGVSRRSRGLFPHTRIDEPAF
jgi:hypothetical protein